MAEKKRVPIKANAFEATRSANSQLLPLFPYMGPGSIVPCCAALQSDGVHSPGYFLHENSVDEILLSVGAQGTMRTGDMMVGPRKHGVGGKSAVPFFAVAIITQRQLDEGEQPETLTFQCEECSAPLFSYSFDAKEAGEGEYAAFPTLIGSDEAALRFNSSEANRTCPNCGHLNAPFPTPIWGWGRYRRNTGIVESAVAALEAATA